MLNYPVNVWDGEATGVAGVEGDSGTRNDGASPAQTATILVQRAPCGRWQHKSWQASELEWGTDSNGDPESLAPKDATEIVQWVDECGGPAKDDVERKVPYTLVSDGPIEIEGVWNRKVEYRAYSTCAGGTDSELLSGQRALPRHWSVPGELDGGSMSITLTGSETAGLTSPGVVTPGSTTALILPSGGGVSLNVSGAKDTDTYSYWNVPEKTADDAIIYKWTVTDEDGNETELDTTAATSSWSGVAAGTYIITGTVDDAWSVDEDGVKESGVTAPDLGERNDDEIVYVVAVTVMAKEWSAGKEIGFRPAEDESGERIEPVEWIEDGKLLLPKLGNETKAIPGEVVELEVEEASDWDAWERAGIDGGIADDSGALTYKWTATGGKFRVPGENGAFNEVTEVTGRKATWIAPAVAEGEANSFTVTCTIDDGTLPRVVDPETGSHDDQALKRTVSIEVVPSYWAPEDKSIGFEPILGEDEQPVKPYQWSENGRITAPIDQRVEDVNKELLVTPGESVTATIEPAQDWDTLTTLEGKTIERDQPLTYVWSSGEIGHFLIPGENGGEPTQAATATGLSVTWVAPDDIDEETEVELKCTIDDSEGKRAGTFGGTRNDEALERVVKVHVLQNDIEKLQYSEDGKSLDDEEKAWIDVPKVGEEGYPLTVIQGNDMLFRAVKKAPESSWPEGRPLWEADWEGGNEGIYTLRDADGGTGTALVRFDSDSEDEDDLKQLSATCISTVTADIRVLKSYLVSLTFAEDARESLLVNGEDERSDTELKVKYTDYDGNPVPDATVELRSRYSDEEGNPVEGSRAGKFKDKNDANGSVVTDENGKTTVTLNSQGEATVALSVRYGSPLWPLGTALVDAVPLDNNPVVSEFLSVEFDPPVADVTHLDWEAVNPDSSGTTYRCEHNIFLSYDDAPVADRSISLRITGIAQINDDGSTTDVETNGHPEYWATFDTGPTSQLMTGPDGTVIANMIWLRSDIEPKKYEVYYEVIDNQIP